MSSFLLIVVFIATAYPSRTAWPCACSSYFRGVLPLCVLHDPCRSRSDRRTHSYPAMPVPVPLPARSSAKTAGTTPGRPHPRLTSWRRQTPHRRGKFSRAPDRSGVLHRFKFPGILGLRARPFRCPDLRKMALREQVRVSRFFKHGALAEGRFAGAETRVPRYLIWNQPLLPGLENRSRALKFFATFSLTRVIPGGCRRWLDNLWTTSRNYLFYMCFPRRKNQCGPMDRTIGGKVCGGAGKA